MTGRPTDPRPAAAANLPPKDCGGCGQPFTPHANEYPSEYAKRRYCSAPCANRHRRPPTDARPARRGPVGDLKWRLDGACRWEDPDLFYPEGEGRMPVGQIRHAKLTCYLCPVRQPCLEFALRNREQGIWGGTTQTEREAILDRRRGGAA